jgi:hemolysin activation/secretion protein
MSTQRLLAKAAGIAALAASVASANSVMAQAIQRNLPPAPEAQPVAPSLAPDNVTPANQDATPLGPALSGVVLLGPSDPVKATAPGLDTALVKRMDTPKGRAILARFIGKPLSHKLIAEVEDAVARYYRRAGYPLLSLSTPQQNITTGVLQVRVIEFQVGKVKIKGAKNPSPIREGVRVEHGQPVAADQLDQDLDWLNRYPYRHVDAVFSPGSALGETDLTLQDAETQPFRLYGGYSNSGSPATKWDRYFVGGSVGGLVVPGSQVSYQFTGSPDAFGGAKDPTYLSHGARFSVPVGARQDIEGTLDYVEMNTVSGWFASKQTIEELAFGYKSALSNVIALPGDATVGVEAKSVSAKTYFVGYDVLNKLAEVYQVYVGYSDAWSNRIGHGDLTALVHVSPGDIDNRNSSPNLWTFSAGRISDATYAYLNVQADETIRLPYRWTWSETLIAQYGSSALPSTEQLGLGGQSLVRGYSFDDGSFDNGFVLRSELRSPSMTFARKGWADAASAYAFVDVGHGWERVVHAQAAPASVGAGLDEQLTTHLTASLDYAYALETTTATRSGDSRLETRVSVGF